MDLGRPSRGYGVRRARRITRPPSPPRRGGAVRNARTRAASGGVVSQSLISSRRIGRSPGECRPLPTITSTRWRPRERSARRKVRTFSRARAAVWRCRSQVPVGVPSRARRCSAVRSRRSATTRPSAFVITNAGVFRRGLTLMPGPRAVGTRWGESGRRTAPSAATDSRKLGSGVAREILRCGSLPNGRCERGFRRSLLTEA